MTNCNCRNRFDCTTLAIMASLVVGIAAAILRFTAIIAVPTVFLWVAFGIAVAYLAIAFVSVTGRTRTRECTCDAIPLLLLGILVTILTSVILLAVEFAATSVLGAIITGVLLAAFSLIFTTAACFVKCVTDDGCDEE